MRSTRATFAVERLNQRSPDKQYSMSHTGSGLFILMERGENGAVPVSSALTLDDFVQFVKATGPQEIRRVTKNDAAFAKQLIRKPQQ